MQWPSPTPQLIPPQERLAVGWRRPSNAFSRPKLTLNSSFPGKITYLCVGGARECAPF